MNHCYVDTEVEMKEIYTSNHIWKLFDNFLVDMSSVSLSDLKVDWCFHSEAPCVSSYSTFGDYVLSLFIRSAYRK